MSTATVPYAKIQEFLRKLAEEQNGTFTEYTDSSYIISLRLKSGRHQGVKAFIEETKDEGILLNFMSKILMIEEYPEQNYAYFLERNNEMRHSKVVIDRGYLEVASAINYEMSTAEQVRSILMEVANNADKLEEELTGKDVM